ncbi:succinate dehydrogenase assembly factor 3, mitochondrial [Cimex lectularius]|uniref:Succinate dehydrogenase assembly factor 3 n=1 Tax=Cimex lectularius TaxID=79782 RepID=A0A8I6RYN8_CIMLE|nr:succinate dehydrogenase assembly factor 3, mitochondrial [Cimex lectularius]
MSNAQHTLKVRFLYKTILRLHRGLPAELNIIGTAYVKDEFRRHKTCDAATAVKFLSGWADYAVMLAEQLGVKGPKTTSKLGKHINEDLLEQMSDEQVAQLYELMKTTKNPS